MFVGKLRPFQVEAVEKMIAQHRQLVAYDLGTGKTVLTIATIEHLLETGAVDLGLVVCANTLKYQWMHELAKFTDKAKVAIVEGDPRKRWRQYKRILAGHYEYVIVNWDQVKNDWGFIGDIDWDFVVLDEATVIKGFTSKVSKRVKKLQPEYRYALSGQPLENTPEDIFSIMQFVDKKVLGPFVDYDRTFIERKASGQIARLRNLDLWHEVMAPHWVRKKRTDPDVAKYMPKVAPEQVFSAELDHPGKVLYRRIADELLQELYDARTGSFDIMSHYGEGDSNSDFAVRGRIMSRLTALRMLCNHPQLLRTSAANWEKYRVVDADGVATAKHGSQYAWDLREAGLLDNLKSTPKLDQLVALNDQILSADPKNKIVVFSFFVDMLRYIGEAMPRVGHVYFDGQMTAKAKDTAKLKFLNDPHCRLFISSDSGGYGVNLPNANYLTSFDLPWSKGVLDQRNGRIIRLSSEFDTVFHQVMTVRGSIEERQYEMLDLKGAMASAMVDNEGEIFDGSLKIDLDTLTKFLEETDV